MDNINEYHKRKMEYLQNKEPERYKLIDTGIGFIVADTLAHKNHETKSDYHLIPELNRRDPEDSNAQDLIDKLNELDFTVNSNLYTDGNYWLLDIKKRLYHELRAKIEASLNDFTGYDSFKINLVHYDGVGYIDEIEIETTIKGKGHPLPVKQIDESPLLDALVTNKLLAVLDDYLNEVENSNDHDNMIREDTLLELKTRLLAELMEETK